jgi:hypothetical protein
MADRCARMLVGGLLLMAAAGGARGAEPAGLELELNKIEQTDSSCRLIFKTTNHMQADIESFAIELYLLDGKGVVLDSVQFTFGAVATAKARFSKFEMKDRKCGDIGGLFVNDVKSCKAKTEIAEQCRRSLQLRNLTVTTFSDGSP